MAQGVVPSFVGVEQNEVIAGYASMYGSQHRCLDETCCHHPLEVGVVVDELELMSVLEAGHHIEGGEQARVPPGVPEKRRGVGDELCSGDRVSARKEGHIVPAPNQLLREQVYDQLGSPVRDWWDPDLQRGNHSYLRELALPRT